MMANYENRALLDLAHRVQECQLQLPGVCEHFSPNGCEPAHANGQEYGKGMGLKAHDVYHAAACHSCHAELDQGNKFTREGKLGYWRRGWERTILLYFRMGWLKVAK